MDSLENVNSHWNFIHARAPWFGAIWERCLRIPKQSLRRLLGTALVTYEKLYNILKELEATVEDHPLTYPYSELEELEALIPSHLI